MGINTNIKKAGKRLLLSGFLISLIVSSNAYAEDVVPSTKLVPEISSQTISADQYFNNLGDESKNSIKKQSELFTLTPEIEKLIQEHDSYYAGYYVDGDKIVVQVKGSLEKIKLFDNNLKPFTEKIKYEVVKNSKKEIDQVKKEIEVYLANGKIQGLVGTGIDVKKNKAIAFVQDFSVKNQIDSLVDTNLVEFYKLSIEDQVKPGDSILTSQSSKCTAAFNAVINSKAVTVTAGHCANAPGGTGAWKLGSTTIGNWTSRSSGNTSADAGYITLNSQNYIEAIEKKTSIAVGRGDDYGSYDTVGTQVFISAPSATSLVSANVVFQNVNVDLGGQNGYNIITGVRITDSGVPQSGDSGAPVLQFRWNPDKQNYDFVVEGIHKGQAYYTDQNGQEKVGTIYSSYAGTVNALGISALYTQ